MNEKEAFLSYAVDHHAGGPQTWKTAAMLRNKGIVSPEMVTREAFPGTSPGTLGTYRAAYSRDVARVFARDREQMPLVTDTGVWHGKTVAGGVV